MYIHKINSYNPLSINLISISISKLKYTISKLIPGKMNVNMIWIYKYIIYLF